MRADTHAGPEQHAPHTRPNTLMQHLTFVVLAVCLATRGRAIHMAQRVDSPHRSIPTSAEGTADSPPPSARSATTPLPGSGHFKGREPPLHQCPRSNIQLMLLGIVMREN